MVPHFTPFFGCIDTRTFVPTESEVLTSPPLDFLLFAPADAPEVA